MRRPAFHVLGPVAALGALAVLAGCASGSQGAVLSVTVLGGDRIMELAGTLQLAVDVSTTGGANNAVTWQSSDAGILRVDDSGTVIGLGLGQATVRAVSVFDPGKSGSIDVTVIKATAPGATWTRQFASEGAEEATTVRFTPDGGVVTAGFTRKGNLGGVTAVQTDAFVIKLNPNGGTGWIRQFGSGSGEETYGLAVDADGNVFVGGDTHGDLAVANLGLSDAYVRKYDSTGDIVWTRQFGTGGHDSVMSLAAAGDGSVVAAGNTLGDLAGVSAGSRDVFVRKYDAAGTVVWTRQFGSPETDSGWGVAVDADGRIAVVGFTSGVLAGDSAGSVDVFVRLYDADGGVLWTRQFGTAANDFGQAVAFDPEGNVLVAGWTEGALSGTSAGFTDAFVRKYDPEGQALWTHQFGTYTVDEAHGVATDASGNVFVAGFTAGDLAGPLAGPVDAFLRKLTPTGTEVWTVQVNGGDETFANAVDAAADGRTVIAGGTYGAFEGVAAVSSDLFVRRYPR